MPTPLAFSARNVSSDGTIRAENAVFGRVLILLAGLLLLAGCKVSGAVVIDVDRDGSGTVTVEAFLDETAARRLGDPETEVRTDDLEAAGWERLPVRQLGVDTVLAVRKRFEAPDQLQSVLDEVADGVFSGFTVEVEDGFASTTWTVNGRVEVDGDLASFGDERLAAVLDGLPIGRTAEELAAEFDGEPTVPVDVVVGLPGDVEQAAGGSDEGRGLRVSVDLARGGPQQVEVSVTGSERQRGPLLLFGAAALLVVLAAIWRIGRTVRGRGSRRAVTAPR